MANPIVFRLSSIDQSSPRVHVRYALCYPCGTDAASIEDIKTKLTASLKRCVSYMPIFAGKVYPVPPQAESASNRRHSFAEYPPRQWQYPVILQRRSTVAQDTNNEQRGRLEVRVTLDEVNAFEPTFKILSSNQFPYGFATLSEEGMPPGLLIGDAFTPLADEPERPQDYNNGSPACAVQANFIFGGVIVALYLHHAVAGVQGLAALLGCMSASEETLPSHVDLTANDIRDVALEESRLRDRLSGSRGYQANLDDHPVYRPLAAPTNTPQTVSDVDDQPICKVLAFSLRMLDSIRDLANEHFALMNQDTTSRVSRFDCMLSILWKALTRARWSQAMAIEGQTSALVIPISIRKRVDPALNGAYYGNCDMFSYTESTITKLTSPLDVITIANTALSVRKGFSRVTDPKIRSAIAIINEAEDVRSVTRPCIDFCSDVFMTNWTDVLVGENTTLGMGLGTAAWARKLSREHSSYDCILLPLSGNIAWEIMVSLPESQMQRLLEDPGLERFLVGHA